MSDLPRKNGWSIAEYTADTSPDRAQRLLNHPVWDHEQAMAVIRGFVAEQLGGARLVVAAWMSRGRKRAVRPQSGCSGNTWSAPEHDSADKPTYHDDIKVRLPYQEPVSPVRL